MEISLFMTGFIVFVLACIVGYHVIWGVTPSLHTPLMAVTNAISGIIVVAAMMVAGDESSSQMARMFGFAGVALASINIFGGFVVTNRMLAMFKSKSASKTDKTDKSDKNAKQGAKK